MMQNDFAGISCNGNIQTWGSAEETVAPDSCGEGLTYRWGDSMEFVVIGAKVGGDCINLARVYDMLFVGMTMNELIGYDLLRSSMRRKGQTDAL